MSGRGGGGAGVAPEDREVEVVVRGAGRYCELSSQALRAWLEELLAAIAPRASSLGVRLCGDRVMRGINRDFRGRDEVTDVLSFPGEGSVAPGHLGDVVVCVSQARRQAAARGESLEREMKTLLLHAVLHCQGYDHETDDGEMDRRERRLRRRWLRHA